MGHLIFWGVRRSGLGQAGNRLPNRGSLPAKWLAWLGGGVKPPNMSLRTRQKLTMIYWKSDKFWLGRLREFPDIMTQGKTLGELEENLRDAYEFMVLDDVPEDYETKEIAV